MSVEIVNDKLNALFVEEKKFLEGEIRDDWHIQQFQYFFFQLQQLYFNGLDIDRGTKLSFSLWNRQNKYTKNCIRILISIRNSQENGYIQEDSIEEFIISSHKYLKYCIDKKTPSQEHIINTSISFEEAVYKSQDEAYFQPIIKMVEKLNNSEENRFIKNIWLTNSLVSMDYKKGYSDADCLVLLKKSAFDSKEVLKSTRKLLTHLSKHLYLFDPLQHHGFIIINELDQSFYPQSYYPSLLFKNSCALLEEGSSKLSFRYRDDTIEKSLALYNNLKSLIRYAHLNKNSIDLFTLKRFVSNITLLPVLYIQKKDDYIYKKNAFLKLDVYFKNQELFIFAEKIRNEFPYKRFFNSFSSFLHPILLPNLHRVINRSKNDKDFKHLKDICLKFLNDFICQIENERI